MNLEKQFDSSCNTNTMKKSNQNLNKKNTSEKVNKKIKEKEKEKEKEKSKGKEKDLKAKKNSINYNNDFSTITHRANNINIKGTSLSTIKTNKTINTNIIKCPNIDCIKKRFIEGPLTINEIEESNENNIPNGYAFIINIISNWGNKRQVGITEIELFDCNNKKIKINNIKIKSEEGNGMENLNRLFNNKAHTISENEMWTIDINKNIINSQHMNIPLYIYANIDNNKTIFENINYILIWNYNGWEVNKGVKKIEIYKDENIFFSGVIPRGDHTLTTEHFYKIKLRKKYVKKKEKLKGSSSNNNNNKNFLKFDKPIRHERESSFDCNFISCNISVSNKNFKYNKMNKKQIENDNNKNQRNENFSFLNVSSKKKSNPDLNSILSSFKNHFSSSRRCNKEKKNNSYLNIGFIDKFNILYNN